MMPEVPRQTEVHLDVGVPVFYTNNVAMEASNFDVRFRIGQTKSVSPEGVVTVQDVAHLYMSFDHFKAYVRVLNTMAATIEQAATGQTSERAPFKY